MRSSVSAARGQWPANLAHLAGKAELLPGELTDGSRVEAVLNHARPDWVIHLAGYANPGRSYAEADQCWTDNLGRYAVTLRRHHPHQPATANPLRLHRTDLR